MSNQIAAISQHKDCTNFWLLWRKHQDYLYNCCLRWMAGNPTEAEDALSQAMLKAWEKVQQYGGKITNFKGWLTRLTHNLCVDIHRQRSRSANRVEDIEGIREEQALVSSEDTPQLILDREEKNIEIRRAIENLPSRLRETFVLHFYQKLSYQEIALQQEISYDNVCKRISQGRKILRQELKEYFIGKDETDKDSSVTPPETESVKPKEEGRMGKDEAWNCDEDFKLNPFMGKRGAYQAPYESGEFNPCLKVKEEILVSIAVEEVKESEENSQENLEEKSDRHLNSPFANHHWFLEVDKSCFGIRQILDLEQFEGKFGCWRNSSVVSTCCYCVHVSAANDSVDRKCSRRVEIPNSCDCISYSVQLAMTNPELILPKHLVLLMKEQHFVGKIAGKFRRTSRAPPLDFSG